MDSRDGGMTLSAWIWRAALLCDAKSGIVAARWEFHSRTGRGLSSLMPYFISYIAAHKIAACECLDKMGVQLDDSQRLKCDFNRDNGWDVIRQAGPLRTVRCGAPDR
jgi:hypothetical protein